MNRLTKGVSISLPSSPILPRQADIVPAHSCSRFTGGFIFKQSGDVQTAHLPHYEQLGARRSGASGNKCKDNGTLSCLRLDERGASVHSAVPYMSQKIQEHAGRAPRGPGLVTDCQSK